MQEPLGDRLHGATLLDYKVEKQTVNSIIVTCLLFETYSEYDAISKLLKVSQPTDATQLGIHKKGQPTPKCHSF